MAGELRRRAPSDAIIARLHNGEVPLAPHNLDIEQAVLGTMIMHNSAYTKVADLLTADCFFEPMHQRVYTVAAGLIAEGQEATPLTLKTYFPEEFTGNDGVRPVQYLANLAVNAAQPHQLRGYAMLLLDLANKRRLIGLAIRYCQSHLGRDGGRSLPVERKPGRGDRLCQLQNLRYLGLQGRQRRLPARWEADRVVDRAAPTGRPYRRPTGP
jgi:hypothetical protein